MTLLKGRIKNRLFVAAGTIALILGIVGIIVPVLPTTPFLLLAAICYTRGSPRLYKALLSNRFFGTYIDNYLKGRGMSRYMKAWTLSLLWITILCTAIFATESGAVRIILAVVVMGVTVHILLIKTIRKDSAMPF